MRTISVVVCLALCTLAFGHRAKVTPITKVVTMLESMHATAQKEVHAEQVAFAAYKQWCEDSAAEKTRLVAEGNLRIDELVANIGKFEADAVQLAKEIGEHDADIAAWEADVKDATAIRESEHTDFVATHKDYSESIDALERAISELKKQNFDRKQATGLLQRLAVKVTVPAEARRKIEAFLAADPEADASSIGMGYKAPEANAYEFQSVGVVDMLEKLLDKFEDERTALEKEEANNQHSFEMLTQDLHNQIARATEARNQKTEEKAGKEQAAAQAKGDLEDTTGTRDSNAKYLSDMTAQCQTKHEEFEARQKLRAEEVAALEKALEVLKAHVVPNAEKHLPGGASLAQKGASFIQVQSSSKTRDVQRKLALFLREKADKLHSRILSALAVKVQDDPFVKVKKMIQDLIFRLMEEANQEAEHKGWCDTELKSNESVRKQKAAEVETLTSEIDELTANINQLAQEITDLNNALAELDASVAKATEQRQVEKAQNEQTIKDAQEAQQAVAQALTILKEFYAKAGAPALVQQTPTEDAPISWDTPYTGQLGSKGVVDMLEVIQSDFARLETETKADEETAAKAYSDFINESALNKVTMQKDVEFKTDKKQELTGKKEQKIQDREGAQKELDAALAYYEKLKPACIDSGVTYEDRVARREEEIASLKQALEILSGNEIAAPAFLQRQAPIRRH